MNGVNKIAQLSWLLGAALLLGACGQTAGPAESYSHLSLKPGLSAQAASPVYVGAGQTRQLTVYIGTRAATPSDVTWKSNNTAVATVSDNGLVSAKASGNATVRVTLRSDSAVYLDIPVIVTSASGSSGPSDFEKRVLELTNQARAQARTCGTTAYPAAAPLAYNANLRAAAYNHSKDMATRDFFDHVNPDGLGPFQRMQAAGYTGFYTAGENIAAGQSTPESVVAGWLASPGHCANIMNKNFKDLGVGFYQGGRYGSYWTQDFGARY